MGEMANHIERNVFSVLITAALLAYVIDGKYDSTAMPPVPGYHQEVSSPAPSPHAFPIVQLVSSRRGLLAPSPAPSPRGSLAPSPAPSPRGSLAPSPAPSRTGSPSSWQAPSNGETRPNGGKRTRVGVIIGSVIGCVLTLILIGFASVWKYKKVAAAGSGETEKPEPQRSKDHHALLPVKETLVAYSMDYQEAPTKAGNGTAEEKITTAAKASGNRAAIRETSARLTIDRLPSLMDTAARQFTYDQIVRITGNFGNVIGEGGSSTVYYGKLLEGGDVRVAVKKLKESGSQIGDLLEEIRILLRIHHRNLVSLVGFCQEWDVIILVAEYMTNGSLFDVLKARRSTFTWRKRLKIALDAATGPCIQKLAPGSFRYFTTQILSRKSDVYSFGVVLFELITGRPAIISNEKNEKLHLIKWVMPLFMKGEIESLLDPVLKGHCNIHSVQEVAKIAIAATQEPCARPDMSGIVSTLKAALIMETGMS